MKVSSEPICSPTACQADLATTDGEHVAHRDAGQLGRIAQAQMDVPARVMVHARAAAQERGQRDRRMVHQSLADAGQGGDHGDAHVAQVPDRADAGAHQVGRRMDGARRQDHFLGRGTPAPCRRSSR